MTAAAARAATTTSRRRRLWADAKALALPIGAYWTSVLVGMSMFTVLIFVTKGIDTEGVTIMSGFWAGTIGGIAVGQVLGLLRLRTPLVASLAGGLGLITWLGLVGVAVGDPTGGGLILFAVVFVFVFPFFLMSGLWSLGVHTGILATFAPIVWITGTVLVIAEETDTDDAWFAGDKWAIWDLFSAPVLALGVLMILVYLVAREVYRLHHWRLGPVGPDLPLHDNRRGVARGRATPGCGGMFAIVALGTALTFTTALVAPYLWRTGPADDADNSTDRSAPNDADQDGLSDRQEQKRGTDPNNPDTDGDGRTDGTEVRQGTDPKVADAAPADGQGLSEEQMQMAREVARKAGFSLLMLLLMLALGLFGVVVFGMPLRRMLVVQHLRAPFWPVDPTLRVQQHWRMVEIAIGDLGIARNPGDSAAALVERALSETRLVDPDALRRCAVIADRVAYGMGIAPDDTMLARRTAEMTFQTVWSELSEWEKFKAMYRLF